MRDEELNQIGAGDGSAVPAIGSGSRDAESEDSKTCQKVTKRKDTEKKSEKTKSKRHENSLKNLKPFTKETAAANGSKGGTMKGMNAKAIREGIELIRKCDVVGKLFSDLSANKPKMVMASLAVLKHFGASFDQSDEATPQKVELDNRHSGGIDVHVTGLDI